MSVSSWISWACAAVVVAPVGCGEPDAGQEAPPSLCDSETSRAFVRPFEVDAEEYPFSSCALETGHGRMHFFDEGPRDARDTILMVHGNPTWSFLYRDIAKAMIADGHRVIAIDHLGMGMSDAPELARFDYRPRSHSANLEALMVAMDLKNVTLVVQDWGGPVGLGVATRQPERFSRLLIMNTWAWSIDELAPGRDHSLVDWGRTAKMLHASDPLFGCNIMLPLTADTIAKARDPAKGARYAAIREAYLRPALDPATMKPLADAECAAMSTFALSILGDNAFQAEVEAGLPALRGKPLALLSGLRDQLFGALRCDVDALAACPGEAVCTCDPAYTYVSTCDSPQAPDKAFDYMCALDGAVIEQNVDQWLERLGSDALVIRRAEPAAEHMVQEWASEAVIETLRELLAAPA